MISLAAGAAMVFCIEQFSRKSAAGNNAKILFELIQNKTVPVPLVILPL